MSALQILVEIKLILTKVGNVRIPCLLHELLYEIRHTAPLKSRITQESSIDLHNPYL